MLTDSKFVYIHPIALENHEVDLFALDHEDKYFTPASIRDLQHELYKQKRLEELGFQNEDDIEPLSKTAVILVKEGQFVWDEYAKDYIKIMESHFEGDELQFINKSAPLPEEPFPEDDGEEIDLDSLVAIADEDDSDEE